MGASHCTVGCWKSSKHEWSLVRRVIFRYFSGRPSWCYPHVHHVLWGNHHAALKTSKRYRVLAIFGLSFHWPWIPKTANFFTAAGLDRDKPKDTDFSASAGETMATQNTAAGTQSHTPLFIVYNISWPMKARQEMNIPLYYGIKS